MHLSSMNLALERPVTGWPRRLGLKGASPRRVNARNLRQTQPECALDYTLNRDALQQSA